MRVSSANGDSNSGKTTKFKEVAGRKKQKSQRKNGQK